MYHKTLSSIELSLFASRIEAVCDEMGAVLQRTAFSPNIKDRLDFSCAIFDAQGALCAQAAHIPVHMGSMAYAMGDIVNGLQWFDGDMVILNDPYLGGTHLPDVTLIAPLFIAGELIAFIVNRAHHADIGAETPGSMPISKTLAEEGVIIPPSYLIRGHQIQQSMLVSIVSQTTHPEQSSGDFAAQISANKMGLARLRSLLAAMGYARFGMALLQLNDYAQRLALHALSTIPHGVYCFEDLMDDDGLGNENIIIAVKISVTGRGVVVDFSGTAPQTAGNINCPISVAAAGVYYVFSCLMPSYTPACAGRFRDIKLVAPEGCLLNAKRPAAVAAGNVETSTRVVDVVMGALAAAIPDQIPAASHGSMNNLAMGARATLNGDNGMHDKNSADKKTSDEWDYYETIGGGMGAGSLNNGLSGVQTHMTNTRNTPIEVLESLFPLRVKRYALRRNSGGLGLHNGGDGISRCFEFLLPTTVTLLTERRYHVPWGLQGAGSGKAGENFLNVKKLKAKQTFQAQAGDQLTINTPGGGGWGAINRQDKNDA
ncbi:MAG: hydantoinase B/oxoprolinase family protein [Gammaproteobacteria bacterium]|nr:hydantoinase B/oxoprolinase family protein [Gammaproteobacteria bacterium]